MYQNVYNLESIFLVGFDEVKNPQTYRNEIPLEVPKMAVYLVFVAYTGSFSIGLLLSILINLEDIEISPCFLASQPVHEI